MLQDTDTPAIADVQAAPSQDLGRSNSLVDLAARIKIEHKAVSLALRRGVKHAMAAGDLLIEARAVVPHGRWLKWLADNCSELSERTTQLYMKLAKNRATIEKEMANPQSVADLTLNEAAALCALAGRLERLMSFARRSGSCSGQELVDLCVEEGFGVIVDDSYNPFAGRSETEILEWHLFILFQSCNPDAGRSGGEPERVRGSVEWILQRPFQNVAEWLGPEGDKFRRNPFNGGPIPEKFKAAWAAFLAEHHHRELPEVIKELETLQRQVRQAISEGRLQSHKAKGAKKPAR